MISVLTWAFASCSTKATTDASVMPASRGLAQTARPFSVGAADDLAAAPPTRARTRKEGDQGPGVAHGAPFGRSGPASAHSIRLPERPFVALGVE